jgi:hypothetical protein
MWFISSNIKYAKRSEIKKTFAQFRPGPLFFSKPRNKTVSIILFMDVDGFVQTKVLPEFRDVVAILRRLMMETAPDVKETISYGILAFKIKHIIAVINPTKKGITFAFSRGAKFEDTYGLLKGIGKVSRHIKIETIDTIDKEALRYYIKQALELDAK